MSNITDYKRNSMQTVLGSSVKNIDTLEIAYLQSLGATSNQVNEAWMQVFSLNGATSNEWNTAAQEFLLALGAPSDNLADNWNWYWVTNGGAVAYDPGMMTFDGSTGYYSKTITTAGNVVTGIVRFNSASFTGGGLGRILNVTGAGAVNRLAVYAMSSDYADANLQDKVVVVTANSGGTNICVLVSIDDVIDGLDHTVFYSFNGDTGAATFYIDGVDADDTGNASRVAPTTGTLAAGASSVASVGANFNGTANFFGGDAGYCGYDDVYLTNPTDFHHPTNGLQELDETTWTEWGSQPMFWNQYGTMTDNKGSAGNMTANGTITGPA
jgi:hypothetical protein